MIYKRIFPQFEYDTIERKLSSFPGTKDTTAHAPLTFNACSKPLTAKRLRNPPARPMTTTTTSINTPDCRPTESYCS